MFKIADLKFDIQHATLDAFIDDIDFSVKWGIEIQTINKNISGHVWQPKAYSEILMKTAAYEIKTWKQIIDKTISWNGCYNEETEEYRAALYIFEHEDIYDSVIKFTSLHGNGVGITWKAKCNVYWDEKYHSDLDLLIETPIEFNGIWFGKTSEDDAKLILAKAFDPAGFFFIKTDHGVSLFKPKRT
jgi:hypothetical protein